ncbi:MAG: hypothetical protein QXP42_04545 [Candidatus Micrarchaeia archaeon]
MKRGTIYSALIFLLLIGVRTPVAGKIDLFLSDYVEPSEKYQLLPFHVSSGNYTLVVIEGKETFMIDVDPLVILNESEKVKGIFAERVFIDANYDQSIQHILKNIDIFNASRHPSERICRQYTGTDRFECIDHDSCLFACYSVPVCTDTIAAEGFLQSIKEWSTLVYLLDGNITKLKTKVNSGLRSAGDADDALSIVDSIQRTVSAINASKLVQTCGDCFNFCPPPDYNMSAIKNVRTLLSSLRSNLQALDSIDNRTGTLFVNMQERFEYINNRNARYKALTSKMFSIKPTLFARAGISLNCINDTELSMALTLLENLTGEIAEAGKSGEYHRAFLMEEAFDELVSEINETINEDVSLCNMLRNKTADMLKRIDLAAKLSAGNITLETHAALLLTQAKTIEEKTNTTVEKSEVASINSDIDSLIQEADDLIVNATLYQNEKKASESINQTGAGADKGLPCILPVLVLAYLLAFSTLKPNKINKQRIQ